MVEKNHQDKTKASLRLILLINSFKKLNTGCLKLFLAVDNDILTLINRA
jgi:hypothetical protein